MKMTKLRWWIIGLVCVGTIVNYLSRSSLSVAAPAMMKELHFDEQQYSWVVSAFQLCYTIAQPITGYLMDVIGLKIGFFIFALLWSLINMAHALAGGWISLAFLRGLMGLTEASAIPAGIKASAESVSYTHLVITGGIGVLFAITWFLIYNSPNKHPWITHKELRYIEDGQESYLQDDNKKPAVKEIVKKRNFWALAITRFLADPAWGTLSFWMPLYLINVMHLPLKEIAMFAWLPFLAADFGCVAGGFLAKFFMEKMHMTTINARRCSFTIGAVLMISIGFVSITTNPYVAIALMSIGGFAHQTLSTVVITMSADLFKKNEVATVAGLAGSAAWMGQLSFNLFMGALVAIIGYGPFFIALSLFDIIGAIILWVLIKDPEKHHPPMTEQPLASHR